MPVQYVLLPEPGGPITSCPNMAPASSCAAARKLATKAWE